MHVAMNNDIIALLQDNPAEFSFFFDTSRRRTCYIAPERFYSGDLFQDPSTATLPRNVTLTPQMDVFSLGYVHLGCVVTAEMEGREAWSVKQEYKGRKEESAETRGNNNGDT